MQATFSAEDAKELKFIGKKERTRSTPETVRRLSYYYFLMHPERKAEFERSPADPQEQGFNGLLGILPLDLLGLEQGPAGASWAV